MVWFTRAISHLIAHHNNYYDNMMQALVQLLAQTRDNLQYPWDNAFIAWLP